MNKTIAKFLFYTVAVVLVGWTASLTIAFVANALPNAHWMVPYFSLVTFDGGMIAWLIVFLYHAEGSGQRVVAIALTVLDLIGVSLMVVAEVFLGGQSLVEAPEMLGEYALWAIGVWTVLNVAGVVAFHLLDKDNLQRMAIQNEKDEIFSGALKLFQKKRLNMQHELSDQIADGLMAALTAELDTDADRNGIPDIMQPQRVAIAQDAPPMPTVTTPASGDRPNASSH